MQSHQQKLLLGAHLSIAGGLANALKTASILECTCVQIFTHSNRQWHMKPLGEEDVIHFKTAQKETGISRIIAHASYLINPASPQQSTRLLSIKTIIQELLRCKQLGIDSLVLHPGSYLTGSEETGSSYLAESLDESLEAVPGKVSILIENMAGQGSSLGRRFEQLTCIRNKIHHKNRIGFCIDTCHLFAAGYDFSQEKAYDLLWKDFSDIVGFQHLKALHMNDSKNKCGSHVDRHTHIGEGALGLESFRFIMNDERFFDIPKILETPKGTGLIEDQRNLKTLKSLLNEANQKIFLHQ